MTSVLTTGPAQAVIVRLTLSAEIRTLIEESGLAYRRIDDLSRRRGGYVLSAASISRVATGKVVPAWPWLEQLLKLLGVPPQVIEHVWRPKLTQAIAVTNAHDINERTAGLLAGSAGGATCPICFAWAVDPDGHQRWHEEQAKPPADAGKRHRFGMRGAFNRS
ncbi:helix-turn-helix transcriptional regulator [Dactylosporangium sp. NPDC050588]|uniref:helix-turn-helix transcriptional regulator n=1 Tax=Dactylosporangium sp. NPDC050588 TaxID=3157211 RepID=UPI0033FCB9C1